MMNNRTPIPVPLQVRWRQWRHHALPIICFLGSALLVGWLWQRQVVTGRAVGEVIAVRAEVGAPCNGVIVELPRPTSGQWSELDLVQQGDIVARVRPSAIPGTVLDTEHSDTSPIPVNSPIEGCILAIHLRSGQFVQASEPIMTITGNQARFILAYIPERMLGDTKDGSSIKVSPRTNQRGYVACTVERVGLSTEQIPQYHDPNATAPKWGVPVRIRLPEGIRLRPGSLVDVSL